MKQHPDIPELLNRYWEGETTLEEERWLKALFNSGNFPAEYQREAQLFQALAQEQSLQFPASRPVKISRRFGRFTLLAAVFLLLLSAGLWYWQSQPASVPNQPVVQINPVEQPVQTIPETLPTSAKTTAPPTKLATTHHRSPKRRLHQSPPVTPPDAAIEEDSYDDPEQALAEIKAALALVSSKINKSKRTLDKGLQEVERIDIFNN